MVGQEILVLFIMVRIRAPQPNKKHPTLVFARIAQIDLRICAAKHYQCFVTISENHRFPKMEMGEHPHPPVCAPTTLRVCDASGGKPERNSSREGVPHEVLTKCGRRT